jgi:predicted nucleotide-binding protein
MSNAFALIFDITHLNSNVMLELGMAFQLQRCLEQPAKVFLIAQAEKYSDLNMPGDLNGFFVSTYKVNNDGSILFGDQNSLVMRMTSDIVGELDRDYIESDLEEK